VGNKYNNNDNKGNINNKGQHGDAWPLDINTRLSKLPEI
jgi:hypothetical protein